ncbi:hypothetical protein HMPREF1545_01967 [Oscillibacter sp. KLE 1728]|nr:hypothetical protein HMPREF1546_04330 [Oscillibacter sp. KLE 1745]ERK60659.1 hypothetical protein HMPREF1545_01967 [Oscillibacter sp. KLE 1728]
MYYSRCLLNSLFCFHFCVYRILFIIVFSLPQGPENFELWSTKRN